MKKIIATIFISLLVAVVPINAQAKTYLSEDIVAVVDKYAEEYKISKYLVYAIVEAESSGRTNAISASGKCKGLMQINDKCHKGRMEKLGYTVDQIFEIEANVHTGIDYLMDIKKDSGIDDVAYCLDVYSGNSKAMLNYQNSKLSKYARKIINRAFELTLEEDEVCE